MLRLLKLDAEHYSCNQCGDPFDVRDALIAKGNTYFCSMKCVLEYDKENSTERYS